MNDEKPLLALIIAIGLFLALWLVWARRNSAVCKRTDQIGRFKLEYFDHNEGRFKTVYLEIWYILGPIVGPVDFRADYLNTGKITEVQYYKVHKWAVNYRMEVLN